MKADFRSAEFASQISDLLTSLSRLLAPTKNCKRLNLENEELGMRINSTKTFVLRLNAGGEQRQVFAGKSVLQECTRFNYLGCQFETDSNCTVEFEEKLKKA